MFTQTKFNERTVNSLFDRRVGDMLKINSFCHQDPVASRDVA